MNVRKMKVYQKAFELSNAIYDASKQFPKEETYSLTDQIRKASRTCCVSIAEGYRRREDEPYFLEMISDADKSNIETQVWLDFVRQSGYLGKTKQRALEKKCSDVAKMLSHMQRYPKKYTSQ